MAFNRIVVGLQWGDEGKAKVVDVLASEAEIVVRFQGGANAGHTVVIGDIKYVFHLVPTGLLYPHKLGVIGGGMVVDLPGLLEEAQALESNGPAILNRLFISERTHLIMKYHKLWDEYEDERKGIGTTKRGIGPAYTDKIARKGIRAIDFCYPNHFRTLVTAHLQEKNELFTRIYGKPAVALKDVLEPYESIRNLLAPRITNTAVLLEKFQKEGKSILFEGAQGSLLDIDWGTYPFVTSSNSTVCGIPGSIGLGLRMIDEVIGVTKAYTTRVGNGPFPTELFGELADLIRGTGHNIGDEFGATTGRPRRCGWLDLVALKHSIRMNGVNKLAITKLDVLDKLPEIKVCVKYLYKDKELEHFPAADYILSECKPVYRTYPGWQCPTRGLTNQKDLPPGARNYINMIIEELGVPVQMVSTGPCRQDQLTFS
ncbi:adenylosuccinate synthase [bacterium]|nr:adenylosuccinate synthase [bacterium]